MNARPLAGVLALSTLTFLAHCGGDEATPPQSAGPADSGLPPIPTASDAGNDPVDASSGVTVAGKVVSNNAALAGARVVIQGIEKVTDATGTFQIEGVALPYDVSVILDGTLTTTTAPNGLNVMVVAGLRTHAPVLTVDATQKFSEAVVTGTVDNPDGILLPTGSRFQVLSMNEFGPTYGSNYGLPATPSSGAYSITARWPGDQTKTRATVFGISYYEPNPTGDGIPPFLSVIASSPEIDLSPGVPKAGHSLKASTGQLVHVAGQIKLAAGYTQLRRLLRLRGKNSGAFSFSQDGTQSSFELDVPSSPVLEPAELGVAARNPLTDAFAIVFVPAIANGPAADITVPAAPVQSTPADQEAAVPADATFSWTGPSAGCVYSVRITSSADGSTAYQVITTSNSVKLPDLTTSKAGLTAFSSYKWTVSCTLRDTQDLDKLVVLGSGPPDRGSIGSGERRFSAK